MRPSTSAIGAGSRAQADRAGVISAAESRSAKVRERLDGDHARPDHRSEKPAHRTSDHRYARPHHRHLSHHPAAHHPPPRWGYYTPRYSHWWVHPYYRHVHAGWHVSVHFTYVTYAWTVGWIPPHHRYGWVWVPGWYVGVVWYPGYWRPAAAVPVYSGVSYVYVPGYWYGDVYFDGWYRPSTRDDGGWEWIEGYYLDDGTYVWGYWQPTGDAPEGYTWEPGYYDGEAWVEGFWRPRFQTNMVWVSSWFDDQGVFHAGYWEPTYSRSGEVWIPGWFDGNAWIEGYWVTEQEYGAADPQNWEPEAGWDAGWDDDGDAVEMGDGPKVPLAIPVAPPEEGQTGDADETGGDVHAVPPTLQEQQVSDDGVHRIRTGEGG